MHEIKLAYIVKVKRLEREEYLPTIWYAVILLLLYLLFMLIPQFIMELFYRVRGVSSDMSLISSVWFNALGVALLCICLSPLARACKQEATLPSLEEA